MKKLAIAMALSLLVPSALQAGETKAAAEAKVYFINLKDGDTVSSPFKVQFGLSNMGVAPAGTEKDNTGHHHLLINRPALGKGEDGADELTSPLPADDNHKHFGKGQTETVLSLKPGKHTLQLVLADWSHIPHSQPVMSDVITITVK
ncbi:MAG: DUF4399 domain-containing protein [Filomicrobium sp.]